MINSDVIEEPITVLAVLREVWKADCYPILGNEDWNAAAILDKEALEKGRHAKSEPGDPPGLAHMLTALLTGGLPADARDEIMLVLHTLFDLEYRW